MKSLAVLCAVIVLAVAVQQGHPDDLAKCANKCKSYKDCSADCVYCFNSTVVNQCLPGLNNCGLDCKSDQDCTSNVDDPADWKCKICDPTSKKCVADNCGFKCEYDGDCQKFPEGSCQVCHPQQQICVKDNCYSECKTNQDCLAVDGSCRRCIEGHCYPLCNDAFCGSGVGECSTIPGCVCDGMRGCVSDPTYEGY